MGTSEIRNLDFDNVVLLSMNDDNFPGNHMAQASFVPYNLRAAYGLPTPEHHEGVYAYYFYRLVQRAGGCGTLLFAALTIKSTGEAQPLHLPVGLRERIPGEKGRGGCRCQPR